MRRLNLNHLMSSVATDNNSSLHGSMDNNMLCGVNDGGYGEYTVEGIAKICEMLKINQSLTSIR